MREGNAYEGLLRDSMGRWLQGFYADIGIADNLKEELVAML